MTHMLLGMPFMIVASPTACGGCHNTMACRGSPTTEAIVGDPPPPHFRRIHAIKVLWQNTNEEVVTMRPYSVPSVYGIRKVWNTEAILWPLSPHACDLHNNYTSMGKNCTSIEKLSISRRTSIFLVSGRKITLLTACRQRTSFLLPIRKCFLTFDTRFIDSGTS